MRYRFLFGLRILMKSDGVLQHCRRNFFDSQKCRVTGNCARSFHPLTTSVTHVRWSVIKEPWLGSRILKSSITVAAHYSILRVLPLALRRLAAPLSSEADR